jgi:hypothetical protein
MSCTLVYKQKKFSDGLSLNILKYNWDPPKYKFVIRRRDGKFVFFISQFYLDFEDCKIDAILHASNMQQQISNGVFRHPNLIKDKLERNGSFNPDTKYHPSIFTDPG